MPAVPSPAPELAEGETNITAEIFTTEQAETGKEPSVSQPSLETSLDYLKPTTSGTSEEDTSGKESTDQTAETAATETLEENSQSEKIEAGSEAVPGGGGVDDSTANHFDVKLDSKSEEKAESERQDNVCPGENFSEKDSPDTDDSGDESDEEDSVVYTAERQNHYRKRAKKCIKDFDPYFRSVEYRMNFFEQELKKLRGDDSKAKAKPQVIVDTTGAASSEIVQSIRRMTWADFKPSERPQEAREFSQRFTWDRLKVRPNPQEELESKSTNLSRDQQHGTPSATTKHQHHVLEVLIEDPGVSKRRRVREHTDDRNITKPSSRSAKTYQKSDTVISQTSIPTLQCPERVRICSKFLLDTLHQLVVPDRLFFFKNISHMVFLRPFKLFVLYEVEIRVALKDLEKRWQTKGQTTANEQMIGRNKEQKSKSNDAENQKDDTTATDVSLAPVVKRDTFEALEHLRLLVEFLDNDLKSTFILRKQINAKEDCPIAFSDLWHLYEHGQEVRTPNNHMQVFKIARFTGGRDLLTELLPSDAGEVPSSCIERQESKGAFFVECYSYDFNGTQYGPVRTMFEIRRYEGLRNITSLPVYPLWFDSDHQKERIRLARRGEKFMALARIDRTAHKSYRGLSLDEDAEEVSWTNYPR